MAILAVFSCNYSSRTDGGSCRTGADGNIRWLNTGWNRILGEDCVHTVVGEEVVGDDIRRPQQFGHVQLEKERKYVVVNTG